MKSTMKFFGFFVLALTLSLMACKGDMGDIGPAGPQGEQGIQGEQGVQGEAGEDGRDGADGQNGQDGADGQNGQDGADGQNGQDGEDGEDGEDGNANVIFSQWETITWDSGTNSVSTSYFQHSEGSLLTLDHIDRALIFGYFRTTGGVLMSVPGSYFTNTGINFGLYAIEGIIEIDFLADPVSVGPEGEFRFVIIPPAGRHLASDNPKQAIMDELNAAGVDTKNYDQVYKYFNTLK